MRPYNYPNAMEKLTKVIPFPLIMIGLISLYIRVVKGRDRPYIIPYKRRMSANKPKEYTPKYLKYHKS